MNKNPQYNRQTEPKQCKSEYIFINIYLPKPGKYPSSASVSENK